MTFRNNGFDNLYKAEFQTSRKNYNSNSNSIYCYKIGTNNNLPKRRFEIVILILIHLMSEELNLIQ